MNLRYDDDLGDFTWQEPEEHEPIDVREWFEEMSFRRAAEQLAAEKEHRRRIANDVSH